MSEISGYTDLFKTTAWLIDQAVSDFSEDDYRCRPEGHNPALWILGHVEVCRRHLGLKLGFDMGAADHDAVFNKGGSPDQMPDDLNGEHMLGAFRKTHRHFIETLGSIEPRELSAPIDSVFPNMPKTKAGALRFMFMHESYHTGQLGSLRLLVGRGAVLSRSSSS